MGFGTYAEAHAWALHNIKCGWKYRIERTLGGYIICLLRGEDAPL